MKHLYKLVFALVLSFSTHVFAGTLYMPEGYVADGVDEFIAVLNSSNYEAKGTGHIYYEDGTSISFPISFPSKQRSGITLKDKGVDLNRRFSTVLETEFVNAPVGNPFTGVPTVNEGELTATLIHYDHGRALGANFTPTTSRSWTIAEGYESEHTRDYLMIFNPNENKTNVKMKLAGNHWPFPQDFEFNIGGKSRFSINLHDYVGEGYDQPYGIILDADLPIVAALSHYDDNLGDGVLTMGHPNKGSSTGYMAEGWVSENGVEYVNLLNPNNFVVNIDLVIHYNNGVTEILNVGSLFAYQRLGYKLNDYVNKNEGFMIEYRAYASDNWDWQNKGYPKPGTPVNVVANFIHFDHAGLNGVNFSNTGYKHWQFAEGYTDSDPDRIKEFLLVYNPTEHDANVTVTVHYSDGNDPSTLKLNVPAGRKNGLALHIEDAMRKGSIWYGIRVDSDQDIIPYFTHYDLKFGGSFALNGTGWD